MKAIRRTIKHWWLPSLLLMVATVSFGVVVPGLLSPDSILGYDRTLILTRSPTPELTTLLPTPQPTNLTFAGITPTNQASPTLLSTANCTYTWYYWLGHPDAWMTEFIQIGRLEFSKIEALEIQIPAIPIGPLFDRLD